MISGLWEKGTASLCGTYVELVPLGSAHDGSIWVGFQLCSIFLGTSVEYYQYWSRMKSSYVSGRWKAVFKNLKQLMGKQT